MSAGDVLLWIIIPYLAIAVFVVGHVWRYRTDQFDWTSRSTQLLDRRILGWASPAFHYGALAAVAGHFIGLVIPPSVTEAIGINESAYRWIAAIPGGIAGAVVCVRPEEFTPSDQAWLLLLASGSKLVAGASSWLNWAAGQIDAAVMRLDAEARRVALEQSLGLTLEACDHPWKLVPLSLIAFQLRRMVGLTPARPDRDGGIGVPVNLFDAMRCVLRKRPA